MNAKWDTQQGQEQVSSQSGASLEMRDKVSKQNTGEGTAGTISGVAKQDPDKVFGASPASQLSSCSSIGENSIPRTPSC